ncbi:class I SAM-dependent methyltransferase [Kitasatospora sp. NPDC087314]|uniref:class I SAM-dependent methyltransferase n=1 Tax=Kitasatospora sp. NPDC087314 TaxID=3364068 RepID=UPI003810B907
MTAGPLPPTTPAPSGRTAAQKAMVADGYRDVARGWHRWRREFSTAGAAVTRAVVESARPRPGMRVLDLACGVGEPALTLAPLVGPSGRVVATDLVPEMVGYAGEAAAKAGAAIVFGVADAERLPFADASFDLVTCRNAVMHFPDPGRALAEAHRVLRIGGRIVLTALGPPRATPAVRATIAVILRHTPPGPPAPALPDPYGFAVPDTLGALLTATGFRDVRARTLAAPCPWPGTAEDFWQALPDHAWNLRPMLDRLAPEARRQVAEEAVAALRRYEHDGVLRLTAPTVIAHATR